MDLSIKKQVLPLALIPEISDECHLRLARELAESGFPVLAACADDGWAEQARQIGCAVIPAKNRAQAIREGFAWFLRECPALPGIVLADVECGYSAQDVQTVADALIANPGKLVIAARPRNPRYRGLGSLEKSAAHLAFAAVHGRRIQDPWAGLRAIPAEFAEQLANTDGEGRRLEFNMLLSLHRRGIPVVNAAIETPYRREKGANRRSRFLDVISIFLLPLKFASVSLASLLSDYAVFTVISYLFQYDKWGVATAAGRFVGAVTGYLLNRSIVFKHRGIGWKKELGAMSKFALLAFINFCLAFAIMYPLIDVLHMPRVVAKLIADALLYVVSYIVQRDVVFKRSPAVGSKNL